ncbi:MAG: L-lactate dehydrogenase [Atribacterota bacterium]
MPVHVAIVGVGKVGSTIAFSLLLQGLVDHIFLTGLHEEKVRGEMYDLRHAGAFLSHPVEIDTCSLKELKGSDIIIITASRPIAGMKDRLELLQGNAELFREIVPVLSHNNPDAIFVVVTNPVDIMTYLTLRWGELPAQRVMGTGTLIDSGRFRFLIGTYSGIHPSDVHAYILGEHGESAFAVLSSAQVGGKVLREELPVCRTTCSPKTLPEIFAEAKDGGMMVYRYKGYTNYAIALAVTTLLEAVLKDSGRILPVSTLLEGYLGIEDVCLSVPAVIGRAGILKTLELDFSSQEQDALKRSAEKMKAAIQEALSSLHPV